MHVNPFQAPQNDGSDQDGNHQPESREEVVKLYGATVRQFLFSGIIIGIGGGLLLSLGTNWVIGFTYGFFTGVLFTLGLPAFLIIVGRKNRAIAREQNSPRSKSETEPDGENKIR